MISGIIGVSFFLIWSKADTELVNDRCARQWTFLLLLWHLLAADCTMFEFLWNIGKIHKHNDKNYDVVRNNNDANQGQRRNIDEGILWVVLRPSRHQTAPSHATSCETTFRRIFNYAPASNSLFSNAKLESRQSNYFELQLNVCDILFVGATAAAAEANSFDWTLFFL